MRHRLMSLSVVLVIGSMLGLRSLSAQPMQSSEPSTVNLQAAAETGGRPDQSEPQEPEAISKRDLGNTVAISEREVLMSAFVVFLGFAVLIIEYLLLRKSHPPPSDVLRVFAVTLIIISALFTITGAFDVAQITPVIGLLGTVAGYLMGKEGVKATQKDE